VGYNFKIEPEVFNEIQSGIDFYNAKRNGLGKRFWDEINSNFKIIRKNPFFQIRYANVRCVPLKKFPFMIHFTVDEKNKEIIIRNIFHTLRDPESTWKS